MANEPKQKQDSARLMGAIDVGTSSIRLVIGQALPDGRWEILERLQRTVRLGQDTFRQGRLRLPTMRSAVAIMRDCRDLLHAYGVDEVRAVGTSAVREASNGDVLIDRILMATDIAVTPISVAEESRLTIAAVRYAADSYLQGKKNALIVQVGGGSTVLILITKGKIEACHSLPIGSIRSQETLGVYPGQTDPMATLIHHQVSSTLSTFSTLLPLKRIQTFITVGADARWTVTTFKQATSLTGVSTVQRAAFDDLVDKCQRFSPDKLMKRYGLSFLELETRIPSLLILQGILHATKAKELIIPDACMVDGLLLDMAQTTSTRYDAAMTQQVIESALAMAEKYGCNLAHIRKVMDLSAGLFDLLHKEHRLVGRYRLLLRVAALLHEVGIFVSSRSHHKHTLYLLAHSEIFGLPQEELQIVANTARYHRRSRPKSSHPEYMALSRENRIIVNKLAALLRIADALDSSRTQQMKKLDARIEGENLWIATDPGGDYTLENRALRVKSDLFEDVYGLKIRTDEPGAADLEAPREDLN